jgi:hypothetical protein
LRIGDEDLLEGVVFPERKFGFAFCAPFPPVPALDFFDAVKVDPVLAAPGDSAGSFCAFISS